ncbi:MAG: hypothetical protein QXP65_03375 [Candidatus Hadarchaeales archaeon]
MNARAVVTVILAAIIMVSAINIWYSRPFGKAQTIIEDFENGLGEWAISADVPFDPNNPGHYVEWSITWSDDVASSGRFSLKFFIDGRQDDGTIWIERKIAVEKSSRKQVNVSFDFYSDHESLANTIAVVCAYADVRKPRTEEDFAVIGNANEVVGWKRYSYTANIDIGSSEEIWVALGLSVRWETYMMYYIDNVEVRIL